MQTPLTCSECGYQEWGSSDRPLMNKIKILNHANKMHPEQVARVLKYSLPQLSPSSSKSARTVVHSSRTRDLV